MLGAYDVTRDRLYGHLKKRNTGRVPRLLPLCPLAAPGRDQAALHPRQLQPPPRRRGSRWALNNNVELAYTPHYGSWLNRIETQFKAHRYFTLDGTDHPDHATQARLIRRYIPWRNRNVDDAKLREVVNTANVA
jgi:hypothetical protein